MEGLKKFLDVIFLVTMLLYVALAAIIVVGQAVALVGLNGSLCIWFSEHFMVPACAVCSVTGLVAYGMSYIYRWNAQD